LSLKTKIFSVFTILNLLILNSQNDLNINKFKSNFQELDKALIFDDYDYDLSNFKEISYDLIKEFVVDDNDEPYIKIIDTINNKFYSFGFINMSKNQKGYLVYSKFKDFSDSRFLNCIVFKNDSFETIISLGQRVKGLEKNDVNSIVIPNKFIVTSYETRNGFAYESLNIGKNIDDFNDNYVTNTEQVISEEYFNLVRNKNYSLPKRRLKIHIFDKYFFLSNHNLIPLNIVTGLKNSKSLYSIGNETEKSFNSYYINSYKLKNNESLILILNVYNYDNYNYVADISYLLMDRNKNLKESKRIANISLDKNNNIVSNNYCQILIKDRRLFLKNKDKIYYFKILQ